MEVEKRDVIIACKGKRSESDTIKKAALIEGDTTSEFIRTTMIRESLRIIKKQERREKKEELPDVLKEWGDNAQKDYEDQRKKDKK